MLFACLVATLVQTSASLPAFPGAEGFGALATGGRGGEVVHVTTLADSGAGSFRDAVSRGRRIVLIDVAGDIELKSEVRVGSDITIAGQSAPGEGICLHNYTVSFDGAKNVIARYFRVRQGMTSKGEKKVSLNLYKCSNVILDHISIEWGRWDCIGFTDASDVTMQYCLVGQGVDPQRFGCLCQSDNVTFSHNLWVDNHSRNPKAKGTVQYINNVVYNWGVTGYVGGHSGAEHSADLIGNYFIKGPNSSDHFVGEVTATDHFYQSDNLVDLTRSGMLSGRPVVKGDFGSATLQDAAALHPAVPVTVDSPADALREVLASAGDSLHRDAIDKLLVEQVKSFGKSGAVIHDPKEDGSAEKIEPASKSLNVDNPQGVDSNGYTHIENAVNALCPSPEQQQ